MEEASRLVGTSMNDIVPPQAQVHLLNAQRELLLAVAVTIEHNTSRRSAQRRRGARSSTAVSRRPSRVQLD
jgi:hypothetical protein